MKKNKTLALIVGAGTLASIGVVAATKLLKKENVECAGFQEVTPELITITGGLNEQLETQELYVTLIVSNLLDKLNGDNLPLNSNAFEEIERVFGITEEQIYAAVYDLFYAYNHQVAFEKNVDPYLYVVIDLLEKAHEEDSFLNAHTSLIYECLLEEIHDILG